MGAMGIKHFKTLFLPQFKPNFMINMRIMAEAWAIKTKRKFQTLLLLQFSSDLSRT